MVGALVTAGARTVFTYKMMGWSLPDSPDACLRLIAAVDRKAFLVHLDPCNIINSPERNYRSSDVGSVLRVLGEKGAVVDRAEADPHFSEVEGVVDVPGEVLGVDARDPGAELGVALSDNVPLMLEHLPNEAEYDAARAQVMASDERIGVRFE